MKANNFFKKFASWHLWLNLLGMVAVVVLLLVGLKWWLGVYTHHGEGIEVPDLYGMDYLEATTLLEQQGLRIEANDSTYIKEKPAGCVVIQTPAKGMKVKEGRIIYVTINSLTIPRVRIPDLIDNSSYREAKARLEALEFRVLQPKLIDGEKDWVYGIQWEGRNVRTGDLVARGSQLVLVIGKGYFSEEEGGEDDFGIYIPRQQTFTDDDEPLVDEDDIDDFLPIDVEEEE